jgi:hypothetical protein
MAWKVNVTANRVHLIAFGNRLTLPFGLHLSASPCSFVMVAWSTFHVKQMLGGGRLLATLCAFLRLPPWTGVIGSKVGPLRRKKDPADTGEAGDGPRCPSACARGIETNWQWPAQF